MNILRQHSAGMSVVICAGLGVMAATAGRAAAVGQAAVDNERILATEVRGVEPPATYDFVSVSLTHPGTAVFGHKGEAPGAVGARSVVIQLKDHPAEPLANTTPYPLAFPRPGVKKLLENDRVLVWQYTWHAGQPTPMHFHDKDVVVVFEGKGALKSTTPDGKSTLGTYEFGDIRFNRRDRVHSESLASGEVSAVITELK
jgi:quercetin dioxygenase-like cupin family protein